MKKNFYIALFTLLGILLGFIAHSLIEIPVINLLVSDFEKWNLGLSWDDWILAHDIFAVTLFLFGTIVGFKSGRYWWHAIYIEKRYGWIK